MRELINLNPTVHHEHHSVLNFILRDTLNSINISGVISTIEEGLNVERLKFQANQCLKNKSECKAIRQRISDTEFLLSFLYFHRVHGTG